ncbi:class I SAM-dependent methyltransferase [Patescibacteria group bacterium]|nr:class I SAM-dependent methyltransferase [Patescibacteria group bacterium]
MHLQYLKRFYPDFKRKKILDLGSGRGDFLLECHKEGIDVIGLEPNSEYIKLAEEKLYNYNFKTKIIKGSGENIPFNDNYFDFINCTEVLEHVNEPSIVLKECYRVLNEGGSLFITVHNRFGLMESHYGILFLNWMPRFLGRLYIRFRKKERNTNKHFDKQKINEMHYYIYSNFKKEANNIGFKIFDARFEQINNPKLILNKKFKKIVIFFRNIKMFWLLKLLYFFLRFAYFNTFHLVLKK